MEESKESPKKNFKKRNGAINLSVAVNLGVSQSNLSAEVNLGVSYSTEMG